MNAKTEIKSPLLLFNSFYLSCEPKLDSECLLPETGFDDKPGVFHYVEVW